MKIVIASDIHGSAYWCRKLMELCDREQPQKLILLGDLLYHGPRNDLPRDYAPKEVIPMLSRWKDKILAVRGNCEAEVDQMVLPFPCMSDFSQLLVGDTLFHLTHGHHSCPEALPPLPDTTSLQQAGEGSWLLSLNDSADKPSMTLMLSMPNEPLARHYAANWPRHGEELRAKILLDLDEGLRAN